MTVYFMCTYVYIHAPSRFLWDLLRLANKTLSFPSCAVQWLTIRKFFPVPGHGGLAEKPGSISSWKNKISSGALGPSLQGRIKLVHRQDEGNCLPQ